MGKIEGRISINGRVVGDDVSVGAYSRMIGYVEQSDVHWPNSTVLESLHFYVGFCLCVCVRLHVLLLLCLIFHVFLLLCLIFHVFVS